MSDPRATTGAASTPSVGLNDSTAPSDVRVGADASEHLRSGDWRVAPAPLAAAQRLVERLHYSKGGSNTGTFVHGLMRRNAPLDCMGVAWWIPPTRAAAEANYEGDWRKVLVLHRLVVCPEVPTNGASFLLGASIRLIERTGGWECLLTYADTAQGHSGGIYRATNWEYLGLTKPSDTWVNPEGRQMSRKAGPTTRTKADMEALGCRRVMSAKHRFRRILKPRESEGVLFSLREAA